MSYRTPSSALTFGHLQLRDGRWAIVGNGNRVRTVPMPAWTKVLIDRWALLAGLVDGRVFRALRRGDHLTDSRGMGPDAIADVVFANTAPLELNVAAHDCRRTGPATIRTFWGHFSASRRSRHPSELKMLPGCSGGVGEGLIVSRIDAVGEGAAIWRRTSSAEIVRAQVSASANRRERVWRVWV